MTATQIITLLPLAEKVIFHIGGKIVEIMTEDITSNQLWMQYLITWAMALLIYSVAGNLIIANIKKKLKEKFSK